MTPDSLTPTDQLVLQALLAAPDRPFHGLTKLQKILFIAAHPVEFGLSAKRPIRYLEFKVYKHGPFCEEVYRSLERLEAAGLITHTTKVLSAQSNYPAAPDEEDELAEPRTLHLYETAPDAAAELVGADELDLRLVREAATRWGWLTPGQIEEFVNRRVGLTPELKERFMSTPWHRYVRFAADELRPPGPEPGEPFWRSEQAFLRERASLLAAVGEGLFVAYLDGVRVGTGADDAVLYDEVKRRAGRAPDFIGYLNARGVAGALAPAFA